MAVSSLNRVHPSRRDQAGAWPRRDVAPRAPWSPLCLIDWGAKDLAGDEVDSKEPDWHHLEAKAAHTAVRFNLASSAIMLRATPASTSALRRPAPGLCVLVGRRRYHDDASFGYRVPSKYKLPDCEVLRATAS